MFVLFGLGSFGHALDFERLKHEQLVTRLGSQRVTGFVSNIPAHVRAIALVMCHLAFGLDPVSRAFGSTCLAFLPAFLVFFLRCQPRGLNFGEIELLPVAARQRQSNATIQADCHFSQLRRIELREPSGRVFVRWLNGVVIVIERNVPLTRMDADMQ